MLAGMAAAGAASAASPALLETLRWTAPGSEIAALTTQPSACLSDDPRLPLPVAVQAGQALFNSPALLGGQAAKAGLSCASCHANGRDNPHFLMAGVSEQPGSADVTNSFFSAARSNGRFDPVAIPDLALPGKISRDPAGRALEPFIRTLIVDEFAGKEPSGAELDALSAYVRAIGTCPAGTAANQARRLADQLRLIDQALTGAIAASDSDTALQRALIAAARHQLGLIDERYARPGLAPLRAKLLVASRSLGRLTEVQSAPGKRQRALARWQAHFRTGLAVQLGKREGASLYNLEQLRTVADVGMR